MDYRGCVRLGDIDIDMWLRIACYTTQLCFPLVKKEGEDTGAITLVPDTKEWVPSES
jgi:hypothetical protein